ncbi:hypothetical protein QUF74_13395 [Candidatus Halobeggiatoa sp. HSG11]|nr:hypothetical protein [Candidatus Halobeggiatoa sp. HSG11]
MVYYSIDIDKRQPVIIVLAIISVSVAIWLEQFAPPYFEAPSAMGLFGLLFWGFNKYLWKISFIRTMLGIPNLNGKWKGTLSRTDHGQEIEEKDIEVSLSVMQTWTKMSFVLENNNEDTISGRTRSFSKVIGLYIENKNVIIIRDIFEFQNAQGMSEWRFYNENGRQFLKGTYFSTALRSGTVDLEKI